MRTCLPLSHATLVTDRMTKRLCQRIQAGQVALIHHADMDEMAAESLLEARVRAVINTQPFLTGMYPAAGAKRLLEAGVPLYEAEHDTPDALAELPDGLHVFFGEEHLYAWMGDVWQPLCRLRPVRREEVESRWQEACRGLDKTLSRFLDNTLSYASREKDLLLKPLPHLPLRTDLANRHVVVVVRGKHYRQDLRTLLPYIREYRPVLIAVDGGADALLEFGFVPDLIVGDMDSVSDRALACGAEIVVHAYPSGDAPGQSRVKALGLPHHVLPAPGTSEDIAMLLAFERGAQLIVTIGTHTHMIDFLEKGRKGMASTLIVRAKIGTRLIDAKGVSQLYQPRLSWRGWCLIVGAALIPLAAAVTVNPVTRHAVQMMWKQWILMAW